MFYSWGNISEKRVLPPHIFLPLAFRLFFLGRIDLLKIAMLIILLRYYVKAGLVYSID